MTRDVVQKVEPETHCYRGRSEFGGHKNDIDSERLENPDGLSVRSRE